MGDPHGPRGGLTAAERQRIVAHMNADHADALVAYCEAFGGLSQVSAATMIAVDGLGFDMDATSAAGQQAVRVAFPAPVQSATEARRALVAMWKEARAQSSTT